jgi:hypothetical protein
MKKKRSRLGNISQPESSLDLVQIYSVMENSLPPVNLPTYRLLTGKDDSEFCKRVSEALEIGYQLYGSPSITFNGTDLIAAQAVIWPRNASDFRDSDDDIPF